MDPRVTAQLRYSAEVERPGMLHAAFVRSPHPHARVFGIDASAVPDDVVVLTPDDVADLGLYGCQVKDQRVLADRARHAGDVVAAVAAPTREAARAAARLVEVTYEPPLWLHFLVWIPLALILCLPPLRLIKGLLITLQYANQAAEGRWDRPQ